MIKHPHHRVQAQTLAERITVAIDGYARVQRDAGTPMLLNDIVSSMCAVLGSFIAAVPEPLRQQLYRDVGTMVLMSIEMQLKAGEVPNVEVVAAPAGRGSLQ